MNKKEQIKNLWGDLNLAITNSIRTPYVILKEQASWLTKSTNNLLIGEVDLYQLPNIEYITKTDKKLPNNNAEYILRLKVPSLDNYTYSIFKVIYDLSSPLVRVQTLMSTEDKEQKIKIKEFENYITQILTLTETQKLLAALINEIENKR